MRTTERLCVFAGQSRSELSTDGTDGEKHKYHKLKSLTPFTDNVIPSLQRQITNNYDRRKTFEVQSRRIDTLSLNTKPPKFVAISKPRTFDNTDL